MTICVILLWHPSLALHTAPRAAPALGARRTAPPARALRYGAPRMSTDSNPDSLEDVFEALLKVRLGLDRESRGTSLTYQRRYPISSVAATLCVQESIKVGKGFEEASTAGAKLSDTLLQAATIWDRGCSPVVGAAPRSMHPRSRAPRTQATALCIQETRGSLLRASQELEAPLLGEAVERLWPAAPPQDGEERAVENDRLVRDAVRLKGMGGAEGDVASRGQRQGGRLRRGDASRGDAQWWQRVEVCTTTPQPMCCHVPYSLTPLLPYCLTALLPYSLTRPLPYIDLLTHSLTHSGVHLRRVRPLLCTEQPAATHCGRHICIPGWGAARGDAAGRGDKQRGSAPRGRAARRRRGGMGGGDN